MKRFPSSAGVAGRSPIHRQQEAQHESTRRADCTRRLLRRSFFHREGPGKSEGLLIKLANTWLILNCGGGPTTDRPEVLLETPSDLNRVNSFLNLRVADIRACYKEWGDKGAVFLSEPLLNPDGWEWRCYMRDPDGYLIEVGQYTQLALDWFNKHS